MTRRSNLLIGFLFVATGLVAIGPGCGSTDTSEFTDTSHRDGGPSTDGNPGGNFGEAGYSADARPCTGLCTQQVQCPNGGDTTVSGIVYDPAGKVPLYNVVVYVPNAELDPLDTGASCDRCDGKIYSGKPLTGVQTDAAGRFKIPHMPVGKDIPLVIQLGKWRRKITIPQVAECADTALTDKNQTRLPRKQSEGNIPLIAISTGGADSMECLPLRMGIDISEFTTKGGPAGRIHLYKGQDLVDPDPEESAYATGRFVSKFAGGMPFVASTELWKAKEPLAAYDMVILSCEGDANPTSKPEAARKALYEYESMGGRVFASHWHEYFFREGPQLVKETGTWDPETDEPNDKRMSVVKEDFPKGVAFAEWLQNVKATKVRGQLEVEQARGVLTAVSPTGKAQEWVTISHFPNADSPAAVQFMSYNAPLDATSDAQLCGRAVFTDMHVSSGATDDREGKPGTQFPAGCQGYNPNDPTGGFTSVDLSPQEKALEFMLFDLSSCISNDHEPPPPIVVH